MLRPGPSTDSLDLARDESGQGVRVGRRPGRWHWAITDGLSPWLTRVTRLSGSDDSRSGYKPTRTPAGRQAARRSPPEARPAGAGP